MACNKKTCCMQPGGMLVKGFAISDVVAYLKSVDLQAVTPAAIRDALELDTKDYHRLRTSLARWADAGKIMQPHKGRYMAVPEFQEWDEAFKRIPPEWAKFHNFQVIGHMPKCTKKGAWGQTATFPNRRISIPLSWGGDCKILKHPNFTIEFQTCNSTDPWEIPQVFQFLGWLEMFIHPYEPWELDLRIKQVDVHIDSEHFVIAPGTALKIGHLGKFLLQIYNKQDLGKTRIELPAKINITPGEFIDAFLNVRRTRK